MKERGRIKKAFNKVNIIINKARVIWKLEMICTIMKFTTMKNHSELIYS